MTDQVKDWQLVHKILYGVHPKFTVALAKFVDRNNMSDMKSCVGLVFCSIDKVKTSDVEALLDWGVEISSDSLSMFLNKDNYEEADLLSNDDLGLAVRLKD